MGFRRKRVQRSFLFGLGENYTVIKSSVPFLVKKVWFDSPLKPGQWKLNTDGDCQ